MSKCNGFGPKDCCNMPYKDGLCMGCYEEKLQSSHAAANQRIAELEKELAEAKEGIETFKGMLSAAGNTQRLLEESLQAQRDALVKQADQLVAKDEEIKWLRLEAKKDNNEWAEFATKLLVDAVGETQALVLTQEAVRRKQALSGEKKEGGK